MEFFLYKKHEDNDKVMFKQKIANVSSVNKGHKIDTSSRVRKTVANAAPTIKKKMYNALRRRARKR